LLRQIGRDFEVRESGVDEGLYNGQGPERYVGNLSEQKARAVARSYTDAIIIGADTIVVVDGEVLGKPVDRGDASRMLATLSGRTHDVYTGITLIDCPSGHIASAVERTAVTFRPLSEEEIDEYVASGSPMDKAGAYGIQDDRGAVFVERVEGCFYNVMGLPLSRLYVMLRDFQNRTKE
jgi:septum formation protein